MIKHTKSTDGPGLWTRFRTWTLTWLSWNSLLDGYPGSLKTHTLVIFPYIVYHLSIKRLNLYMQCLGFWPKQYIGTGPKINLTTNWEMFRPILPLLGVLHKSCPSQIHTALHSAWRKVLLPPWKSIIIIRQPCHYDCKYATQYDIQRNNLVFI